MKNLISFILLLSLGIVSTVALAENETVAPVTPSTPAPVAEVADSNESRIVVDFGSDGDSDAAKVDDALEVLDDMFGIDLADKFDELDQHEQEKFLDVIRGQSINIGGGGLGGGEFVIAVLAICLSLGLPVIILLLVFIFGHRKRKQKLQLISSYLEAGQPVPDNVMSDFESKAGDDQQFHSGIRFVLAGIAIAIFCIFMGDEEVAAVSLIPFAIGAAKLISWKFESNKRNA